MCAPPFSLQAHVTGLVGTTGSALAIWTKDSSLDIQICLGGKSRGRPRGGDPTHTERWSFCSVPGHDCLDQAGSRLGPGHRARGHWPFAFQGPAAEEPGTQSQSTVGVSFGGPFLSDHVRTHMSR